jgi:hypothetical protein
MEEIRIIPHASIDQKKWDKVISAYDLPLVFANSFYLNATAPKWDALVLGNYKAVMPLTWSKKLNIKYLHQPPFTSQLGIYGEATKKEIEAIEDILKKNFRLIEIEQNAHLTFPKHVKEKLTYVINYQNGYKYNENTKRNLSKAKKAGIGIKEVKDLPETLKLANSRLIPWLKAKHKTSTKHANFLLKLLHNSYDNGSLKTLVSHDQKGNQLALGYFIFNQFHCVFLKGFSFNKKDNTGSMHALLDHAIRHFEGEVTVFDFGGGSAAGLSTFYKGLGGKELKYQEYKVNNLPWPLKIIKK